MKVSVILCTVFICGLYSTDATICKPDSTFKIDCNLCHCSQNGKSYSCTDHLCPPPDSIEFSEEELPNGYILLKPKVQSDAERIDDEDGFVLTRKQRNEGIPYINDEIPSSIEENTVLDWERPRESDDEVGKGEMEVDKSWESAAYDLVKNAMLEE